MLISSIRSSRPEDCATDKSDSNLSIQSGVAFGGRYAVQIRNGLEFGMEISDQIVSIFGISISGLRLQVIVDKIHMGWSVVYN